MSYKYTWYQYGWVLGLLLNLAGHLVRIFVDSSIGIIMVLTGFVLLSISYLALVRTTIIKTHRLPLFQAIWVGSLALSPLMFNLANTHHIVFAAFILISVVGAGILFQVKYPEL